EVRVLQPEHDAPFEERRADVVDREPGLLAQLAPGRILERLAGIDPAAGREPPVAQLGPRGVEAAQEEHAAVGIDHEDACGETGGGRHTGAGRTASHVASTAATIAGIASRSSAASDCTASGSKFAPPRLSRAGRP